MKHRAHQLITVLTKYTFNVTDLNVLLLIFITAAHHCYKLYGCFLHFL